MGGGGNEEKFSGWDPGSGVSLRGGRAGIPLCIRPRGGGKLGSFLKKKGKRISY